MSALTSSQLSILEKYREITSTSQEADSTSIRLLNSCDWTLELAIEATLDGGTSNLTGDDDKEESKPLIEKFSVDDSQQSTSRHHRNLSRPTVPPPSNNNFIFTLLSKLFSPLTYILSFISSLLPLPLRTRFRLLSLPFSLRFRNPFSTNSNNSFSYKNLTPTQSVEKFIRILESETGYLHPTSFSNATNSSTELVEKDGLTKRNVNTKGKQVEVVREMPNFLLCGYSEAVRKAKEEIKILSVWFGSPVNQDWETWK
jgi:FAS-associated factor 2